MTSRIRGSRTITAILVTLLALMVVRDILARRWGTATLPASDITQHSR